MFYSICTVGVCSVYVYMGTTATTTALMMMLHFMCIKHWPLFLFSAFTSFLFRSFTRAPYIYSVCLYFCFGCCCCCWRCCCCCCCSHRAMCVRAFSFALIPHNIIIVAYSIAWMGTGKALFLWNFVCNTTTVRCVCTATTTAMIWRDTCRKEHVEKSGSFQCKVKHSKIRTFRCFFLSRSAVYYERLRRCAV